MIGFKVFKVNWKFVSVVAFCSIFTTLFCSSLGNPVDIDHSLGYETPFLAFESFKSKYNRTYKTLKGELARFKIFRAALNKISELNSEELGSAEYGITEFADWTEEELFTQLANLEPKKIEVSVQSDATKNSIIPTEFDWRSSDTVTPVKDQGRCGSSWAFANIANIENVYAIKKGYQKFFSEQQLVDCDQASDGCNGGWVESPIQYIIDNNGINYSKDYPYEGRQGSCRFDEYKDSGAVFKFIKLKSNDENNMTKYIKETSSTINCINAKTLQYYIGGIISANQRKCSKSRYSVNHAVLTVGFGVDSRSDMQYWTMKNSWGQNWGENGYSRIERGFNTCGVANFIFSTL